MTKLPVAALVGALPVLASFNATPQYGGTALTPLPLSARQLIVVPPPAPPPRSFAEVIADVLR